MSSNGICVDDRYGSTTPGNPIQIYGSNGSAAQALSFNSDQTIRLLGSCLDWQGLSSGNMLILNTCNGTASQKWLINSANDSVTNAANGQCLDDPHSGTAWWTQLWLYTCNQTNAQNWLLP